LNDIPERAAMKVLLVTLIVLFALCGSSFAQFAYVRFVNGHQQLFVDFYVRGTKQLGSPFAFGASSNYLPFPAGTADFAITLPLLLLPIRQLTAVPLVASSYYTVFAGGSSTGPTLTITTDNPLVNVLSPTIRGVNLASAAPVDIVLDVTSPVTRTLSSALSTGSIDSYKTGNPNVPSIVGLVSSTTGRTLLTNTGIFLPNRAYSVVAIGQGNTIGIPLTILFLDDTAAGIPLTLPGLTPSVPASVGASFPFRLRRKN
jgi:hypothetical protein